MKESVLRAAWGQILKDPSTWDQNDFGPDTWLEEAAQASCGTTLCLGGWVNWTQGEAPGWEGRREDRTWAAPPNSRAMAHLDITQAQADELFYWSPGDCVRSMGHGCSGDDYEEDASGDLQEVPCACGAPFGAVGRGGGDVGELTKHQELVRMAERIFVVLGVRLEVPDDAAAA